MLADVRDDLPAVEINMSFRRDPMPKTIDTWREAVPDGFTFAMKAHQRITMWKKLVDAADDVADVRRRSTAGCSDHLGPILFQLPRGRGSTSM